MAAAVPNASLPNVLAFVRTYEGGSFTAGARSLHQTPAAVSRAVARLEAQLGSLLFKRTTRQLRATAAGESYYARCAAALALLEEGERELEGRAPRGRVRLSIPTTYGLHVITARLAGLREKHPDIQLDVSIANHVVDFVREGFDLAVRLGRIEDATLVARKLADAPLGIFGSPDYLARRGRPRDVEELAGHELLAFVLPRSGRYLPWLLAGPNEEWTPTSDVRCLDDPQGLVALARAGLGLCQIYRFMVEHELARGELVEVLPKRSGRTRPFSLVHPKGQLGPAARLVAEHLLTRPRAR